MPDSSMKKKISDGLPDHELGPNQFGHQAKEFEEHPFGTR